MWRVSTAGSSCLACCEVSVMKEGGRKEEEVACTAWLTRKYEREEGDRRNKRTHSSSRGEKWGDG